MSKFEESSDEELDDKPSQLLQEILYGPPLKNQKTLDSYFPFLPRKTRSNDVSRKINGKADNETLQSLCKPISVCVSRIPLSIIKEIIPKVQVQCKKKKRRRDDYTKRRIKKKTVSKNLQGKVQNTTLEVLSPTICEEQKSPSESKRVTAKKTKRQKQLSKAETLRLSRSKSKKVMEENSVTCLTTPISLAKVPQEEEQAQTCGRTLSLNEVKCMKMDVIVEARSQPKNTNDTVTKESQIANSSDRSDIKVQKTRKRNLLFSESNSRKKCKTVHGLKDLRVSVTDLKYISNDPYVAKWQLKTSGKVEVVKSVNSDVDKITENEVEELSSVLEHPTAASVKVVHTDDCTNELTYKVLKRKPVRPKKEIIRQYNLFRRPRIFLIRVEMLKKHVLHSLCYSASEIMNATEKHIEHLVTNFPKDPRHHSLCLLLDRLRKYSTNNKTPDQCTEAVQLDAKPLCILSNSEESKISILQDTDNNNVQKPKVQTQIKSRSEVINRMDLIQIWRKMLKSEISKTTNSASNSDEISKVASSDLVEHLPQETKQQPSDCHSESSIVENNLPDQSEASTADTEITKLSLENTQKITPEKITRELHTVNVSPEDNPATTKDVQKTGKKDVTFTSRLSELTASISRILRKSFGGESITEDSSVRDVSLDGESSISLPKDQSGGKKPKLRVYKCIICKVPFEGYQALQLHFTTSECKTGQNNPSDLDSSKVNEVQPGGSSQINEKEKAQNKDDVAKAININSVLPDNAAEESDKNNQTDSQPDSQPQVTKSLELSSSETQVAKTMELPLSTTQDAKSPTPALSRTQVAKTVKSPLPEIQNAKTVESSLSISQVAKPRPPLPRTQVVKSVKLPSPKTQVAKTVESPLPIIEVANTMESPSPLTQVAKTVETPSSETQVDETVESPSPITQVAKTVESPSPVTQVAKTVETPLSETQVAETMKSPSLITQVVKTVVSSSSNTQVGKTLESPSLQNQVTKTVKSPSKTVSGLPKKTDQRNHQIFTKTHNNTEVQDNINVAFSQNATTNEIIDDTIDTENFIFCLFGDTEESDTEDTTQTSDSVLDSDPIQNSCFEFVQIPKPSTSSDSSELSKTTGIKKTNEVVEARKSTIPKPANSQTEQPKKERKLKQKRMCSTDDSSHSMECNVCSKVFANRIDLASHIFMHSETELQNAYIRRKRLFENNHNRRSKKKKNKGGNNVTLRKIKEAAPNAERTEKTQETVIELSVKEENERGTTEGESSQQTEDSVPQNSQKKEQHSKTKVQSIKPITVCECHRHEDSSQSVSNLRIEIAILCRICQVLFRRIECLEMHYRYPENTACNQNRMEGRVSKLFCSACRVVLNAAAEMRQHLEMHIRQDRNSTAGFRCNICKIIFYGIGSLFYIHWLHHNDDPFYLASRLSFSKAIMTTEIRNEGGENYLCVIEYVCKVCNAQFPMAEELKKHRLLCGQSHKRNRKSIETPSTQKTNVPDLKLICGLCNNEFDSRTAFEEHSKQHKSKRLAEPQFICIDVTSVKRVFICTVCANVYDNKKDFDSHWPKHAIMREEYICTRCDKNCDSIDAYIQHSKIHAVSEPSCKVTYHETEFCCTVCNIGFESENGLNEHNIVHEKNFPRLSLSCFEDKRISISQPELVSMQNTDRMKLFIEPQLVNQTNKPTSSDSNDEVIVLSPEDNINISNIETVTKDKSPNEANINTSSAEHVVEVRTENPKVQDSQDEIEVLEVRKRTAPCTKKDEAENKTANVSAVTTATSANIQPCTNKPNRGFLRVKPLAELQRSAVHLCQICGLVFDAVDKLSEHLSSHEKTEEKNEQKDETEVKSSVIVKPTRSPRLLRPASTVQAKLVRPMISPVALNTVTPTPSTSAITHRLPVYPIMRNEIRSRQPQQQPRTHSSFQRSPRLIAPAPPKVTTANAVPQQTETISLLSPMIKLDNSGYFACLYCPTFRGEKLSDFTAHSNTREHESRVQLQQHQQQHQQPWQQPNQEQQQQWVQPSQQQQQQWQQPQQEQPQLQQLQRVPQQQQWQQPQVEQQTTAILISPITVTETFMHKQQGNSRIQQSNSTISYIYPTLGVGGITHIAGQQMRIDTDTTQQQQCQKQSSSQGCRNW